MATFSHHHYGKAALLRSILRVITPSWLSACLCICIALGVGASVVVIHRYQGSALQQEVVVWQTPQTAKEAYAAAFNAAYGTTRWQAISGAFSTWLVWAFSGLMLYSVVFGIYDAIHSARTFKAELSYVNVNRTHLKRTMVIRIVLRLSVLAAWFGYVLFFFGKVVPYGLTAAHLAATRGVPVVAVLCYGLGAVLALSLALHIHVILLRLLLLRQRVFGTVG
ncbi:MAG TPA: hypothetical protein VLF69_03160 [Candidatus Saccharimonadales bacterium]|nr:hypothetical protein [Candidatus Saccharimonadales bacterium]